MKTLLYLVRHGETEANKKGIFRGLRDYPLDNDGRKAAGEIAKYFKDKEIKINDLYSSDLKRATETAEVVGKAIGKEPQEFKELRPWDVGEFAGKNKKKHGAELDEYRNSPGIDVPGGESLNDFRDRFRKFFVEGLIGAARAGKPCLWITSASDVHEAANIVHGDIARGEILPGGIAAVVVGPRGIKLEILTGHNEDEATKGVS